MTLFESALSNIAFNAVWDIVKSLTSYYGLRDYLKTEYLEKFQTEEINTISAYRIDSKETGEERFWKENFEVVPERLTAQDKREWLNTVSGVSLGSDAFFPFRDNIDRAKQSGVSYIIQPGGSVRDDIVIDACNEHNLVMVFTKTRLFHH